MNLSTPILICDPSEEFRSLLRDMLTKHGFFHIMEAINESEVLTHFSNEKKDIFILIQSQLLSENIINQLSNNHFLILAQTNQPKTIDLASRLGVRNFISFPFSSQGLVQKISTLSQ